MYIKQVEALVASCHRVCVYRRALQWITFGFWYSVFRDWGRVNRYFRLELQKKIFAHYILIVFCTKDTCNEMATSQLK